MPLLMACSDSYPGLVYEGVGDGSNVTNQESYDKTPVMVFINEQDFFSVSATRGSGPFDADDETYKNKYDNSRFYVFSFRAGKDKQGVLATDPDLSVSRWNAVPVTDDYEGKDCLIDGPDFRFGLPANLSTDEPGFFDFKFASEEERTRYEHVTYYSTRYQEVPYNFFAYYIDDAADRGFTARRTQSSVVYEFDIDGSQDIMCGYAPFPKNKTELEDLLGNGALRISETEANKILNIGGFSTFSGHRAVNPVVDLNHQLVRLDFKAYPGDEGADSITIDGIKVECPTHCTLTVASTDTSAIGAVFSGVNNDLWLRERSVDGLTATEPLQSINMGEVLPRAEYEASGGGRFVDIGGCLMVPEAMSYKITLYFKQQMNGTFRSSYVTYNVSLSENTPFRKGYYYPISIAVYGYQKIKLDTNLSPWLQGGEDINIGGDDGEYDDTANK